MFIVIEPTVAWLGDIPSQIFLFISGGWNCFWDLRFTSNLRKKCLRFEIFNLTEIWDFSLSHWELRFQKNDLRSEILDEIHQTSEIFAVFSKKTWRYAPFQWLHFVTITNFSDRLVFSNFVREDTEFTALGAEVFKGPHFFTYPQGGLISLWPVRGSHIFLTTSVGVHYILNDMFS